MFAVATLRIPPDYAFGPHSLLNLYGFIKPKDVMRRSLKNAEEQKYCFSNVLYFSKATGLRYERQRISLLVALVTFPMHKIYRDD